MQLNLMVSDSMEPVKEKGFVMVGAWWREEAGTNCAINNTPDAFSYMGFVVDVSKLHVWSCVHHIKLFKKVMLM